MTEARPVLTSCINTTPWLGFSDQWREEDKYKVSEQLYSPIIKEIMEEDPQQIHGHIDDNMSELGDMQMMKLAFSRVHRVIICSDQDRVHGVELAIKLHEQKDEDFPADMDPEMIQKIKEANLMWDTGSSAYYTKKLKMIGSYTLPCYYMDIENEDKIKSIEAVSDGEHLRQLKFIMASHKENVYGLNEVSDMMDKQTWDFVGKDIVGAFGYSKGMENDPLNSDYIVSLGWIVNECPVRGLLDYERQWYIDKGIYHGSVLETEYEKYAEGHEIGIAIALVSIISICLVLGGIYCLLKNRGAICNKKSKPPGMQVDMSDQSGKLPDNHIDQEDDRQ